MIATTVTIYVKSEFIDDFIRATVENHEKSILEPANLRFDFCRCNDDPARFLLFEVYDSEEGAAEHKQTAHYKKWKETVADWMSAPRVGVKHSVIKPENPARWKALQ